MSPLPVLAGLLGVTDDGDTQEQRSEQNLWEERGHDGPIWLPVIANGGPRELFRLGMST